MAKQDDKIKSHWIWMVITDKERSRYVTLYCHVVPIPSVSMMTYYWLVRIVYLLWNLHIVHTLTGHVCTREKAENYISSFNQAFICQERYTTSCGTLDWRRCTRYRIQTCYTPQRKYSTRFRQVEQCCPGWREDGSGACSIPVCPNLCLNGGTCVNDGGVPACVCEEGYSGEGCQTANNDWHAWYTVVLVGFAVIVIIFVALLVYCCKRHGYICVPSKSSPRTNGYRRLIQTSRLDPGCHDNNAPSWIPLNQTTHGVNPSAPLDTLPETSC